ncbi:hypothetical protein ACGF0D_42505 [Kitasatospora sp. NPDC048298]|uniref:hypothetical protein n=1 Tax=Kitasatospora sp. NPDC048298 TaxID=3364049 RepID=UPI00371CC665
MIVSKRNSLRLASVAVLGVLVLGTAGTAMAAVTPAASTTSASAPAAPAGITAKPSVSSVAEHIHAYADTLGGFGVRHE